MIQIPVRPVVWLVLAATIPTSSCGKILLAAEQNEKATLSAITAAWKRREQQIKSGEFLWKEERVISSSPAERNAGPLQAPPREDPANRETIRHAYRMELIFKGEKFRHVNGAPCLSPSPAGMCYRAIDEVLAFDGVVTKSRFAPGRPTGFPYQGSIRPGHDPTMRYLLFMKVLLLHFQPTLT